MDFNEQRLQTQSGGEVLEVLWGLWLALLLLLLLLVPMGMLLWPLCLGLRSFMVVKMVLLMEALRTIHSPSHPMHPILPTPIVPLCFGHTADSCPR